MEETKVSKMADKLQQAAVEKWYEFGIKSKPKFVLDRKEIYDVIGIKTKSYVTVDGKAFTFMIDIPDETEWNLMVNVVFAYYDGDNLCLVLMLNNKSIEDKHPKVFKHFLSYPKELMRNIERTITIKSSLDYPNAELRALFGAFGNTATFAIYRPHLEPMLYAVQPNAKIVLTETECKYVYHEPCYHVTAVTRHSPEVDFTVYFKHPSRPTIYSCPFNWLKINAD